MGEMGAGKDVLASYMEGYLRLAFGDQVRVVAQLVRTHPAATCFYHLCRLFKGEPPNDLLCKIHEWKDYPITNSKDRKLLQDLGTYCRMHDDGIWIRETLAQVKPSNNYVITDCRRFAEFEACKDWLSVFVESTLDERKQRIITRDGEWKDEWSNHASETEIAKLREKCAVIVLNHDDKDELREKASQIIRFPKIINKQIII